MPTSTEINSHDIEAALKSVHDQKSFLNDLLAETLNWPVGTGVTEVDDISYEWSEADLRARELSKKLIAGRVLQVQLTTDQPWGIFILEFASGDVFKTDRGMTGALRQVLRGLVKNRNKPGSLPSWQRENLLFICTHTYEHFRIAHFKAPKEDGRTARLAAFGWGPDIPARTACTFNLNHLGWPSTIVGFDQWAEAFNVEKVTKKFYGEYSHEFDKLRAAAKGLGSNTEDQKMFTQTLLNRLMFLRFIERKGWLTPPGGSADDRDYLQLLFAAGDYRGKSFYAGRLRRLFFEGLAVEGKQESESIGTSVFLNGGLFEETALDEKVADIPNEAFAALLGPDGLFYRYNFTVQESTPLDIEVAVDPEMLGKVFEELVTGRHESGSYYTPRPVVSFMCREAIKGYLTAKTGATAPATEALVDRHEVTGLTESHARQILQALDSLKAVDPACGSGAYLLGLLHELVILYRLLYSEKLVKDSRTLYELKLRIISNSIYGVDIDKFATNIAMLRLWLSLAVDSNDPMPLPNLEFKIETGDSLTGPDPSQIDDLFRAALQVKADLLVQMKDEYLKSHDKSKHEQLKKIRDLEANIAKQMNDRLGSGVIDWRIHFAEVFAGKPAESTFEGFFPQMNKTPKRQMSFTVGEQRGGFDMVLANPPYVRQELIKDLKPALKAVYGAQFSGTADLYIFFYLRALQLLTRGGMLVFISSNKWFRAAYGQKLRTKMGRDTAVNIILDFHDLPVFESAIAYPMIFIAANRLYRSGEVSTLVEPPTLDSPYPDVSAVVSKFGHPLPNSAFGEDGTWQLTSSSLSSVLAKMRRAGPSLKDFVGTNVLSGIKTGFNEAFVIDGATRSRLINQDSKSKEIIHRYAAGKDIGRWQIRDIDRWVVLTKIGVEIKRYPAIFAHLKQFQDQLERRSDQGNFWWELRPCSYYEAFNGPKIISTKVSIEPTFVLDSSSRLVSNTTYILPVEKDATFLLGVLNSKCSKIHAQNVFVGKQNGWYEVQPKGLEDTPIPEASASDRKAIGALAQKCLDAAGVGCEAWEKEIDERVAALYGL